MRWAIAIMSAVLIGHCVGSLAGEVVDAYEVQP